MPIVAKGDLGITLSSSGAFAATNLGGFATGGIFFKGSVNGPMSVPFTGGVADSFTPLDTTFTTTATFSLKAGIQLTVGPGVGNDKAGVVAGISGEFDPVNASYTLITDSSEDPSQSQQQCVKLDAEVTSGLSLSRAGVVAVANSVEISDRPVAQQFIADRGRPLVHPAELRVEITSTSALPHATQGSAYIASLQATGGTTPYAWAVTSGSLSDGLKLDPASGVISGTPTAAGTSTFQITVTDADGATATKSFTLIVADPLDHLVLSPASASITSGGSQTYTVEGFDASNHDLGPDTGATLSISPDGSCTGYTCTPGNDGDHTVTATDGSASGQADLTVGAGALEVTTNTLHAAWIGTPYSQTLGATGGTPPYTWQITGGSLPGGSPSTPAPA